MANFIKNIQNFAFQHDLWHEGLKIIVGVSGGPDSVCLLHVLAYLAPKYGFQIHIAHVNYDLRGQDSKNDELFVKEIAQKYNFPISVLKPNKKNYNGNLENNLREIRYSFFEEIRSRLNYDLIAIAHNQDDQAETVLMRIIRGSGLNGLSSMKAKSEKIIRPLLNTSKEKILAYNKQNSLKFQKDVTNDDQNFTRNKVRHSLLPYLQKEFNPSIKETLSNWSENVGNDYEYIEQQAKKIAKKYVLKNRATFEANVILKNHISIQRQVIRIIYNTLKDSSLDLETKQVDEILKVIKSTKNKAKKATVASLNVAKNGDIINIFC